jgi:hypothetical protein
LPASARRPPHAGSTPDWPALNANSAKKESPHFQGTILTSQKRFTPQNICGRRGGRPLPYSIVHHPPMLEPLKVRKFTSA